MQEALRYKQLFSKKRKKNKKLKNWKIKNIQ